MTEDFNSHAHVERDLYFMSLLKPIVISTHTLTWSVTALSSVLTVFTVISTHTLTWSVTSYLSLAYDNIDISTHTLTWSVTFQ